VITIGIGDLATLITVAGVTIYVLGLIGLAIPIRRILAGNLSAAWYAVSLVPKTVVAGQGVRIWMRWPLVIAALLFLVVTGVRIVLPASPPTTYLLVVVVAWLIITPIILIHLEDVVRIEGQTKNFLYWCALGVPGVLGFVCVYFGVALFFELGVVELVRPAIREAVSIIIPLEGGPYIVRGIVFFLIGSFFLGLPLAIWTSLPLAKVKVTKQTESKIQGDPHPLEGWLVAHSDGFWHLFVVAGEQKEQKEQLHAYEQCQLLSIPDATVLEMRMLAEEDTATSTTQNADPKSEQEKAG